MKSAWLIDIAPGGSCVEAS